MSGWPRAVIFDLDGTLIDSVGDIADVLNDALREQDIATLPEEVVRLMIGSGARILIERALAHLRIPGEEARVTALHHRFEHLYAAVGAGRSVVFPGGREVLSRLSRDGRRLGICTNKPHHVTRGVLDALGLSNLFGAVVGATDDVARKPAPDMLNQALAALEVGPGEAVMLGDSATDVATARAAGVPVLLVSFGYTTVPAAQLGADAVIDALAELPDALARMAAALGH